MMTNRFLIKSISMFLAVLMTILVVPLSVYAEIFDVPQTEGDVDDALEQLVKPEVYELVDRREENVKHFKQSDGTVTAVMYETPVHYLDGDGEWQDIDNTLADDGSEYTTSNARVKLAKKTTGNGVLFTLHENNTKITISLDGANKKVAGQVTNTVTEHGEEATELQKQMTLDKLSSRILYSDILDGVDLEYVVKSGNIKENIIVKEKLDSYSYSFTVSLNNLTAILNADGSVSLKNGSNETVYTIPSGHMYDANGEYSEAVTYTLTDLENGKYTFGVTADASWINAADRVFPVTIDPPIVSDESAITDLYISSATPSTSYANGAYLYMGSEHRTYIKLNGLPILPSNAYLTDAYITLNCVSGHGYPIGAYQVMTSWGNNLTWNSLSSAGEKSTSILDYVDLDLNANGQDYRYSWNISTLVREWYNGTSPNYGVCLTAVDGVTAEGSALFYSSENTTSGTAPCFIINYIDMKGLESYWTQLSHSAGLAGAGSVNVANGNLTFVQSTVSSIDSLFGYTPLLVYNSSLAGRAYTSANAQIPQTTSYMPYGFKLSINETLIRKSYSLPNGTPGYYYVWADGDGTEHSFFAIEGSSTEYMDEDGLQLTLNTSASNALTITDLDHNVRKFDAMSSSYVNTTWYLTSITDKYGNVLSFDFDANYRPTSVDIKPNNNEFYIEQLRIVYNLAGAPAVIYQPWAGGEAILLKYSSSTSDVITYYSTTYLREVVYVVNKGSAMADSPWLQYYNNPSSNSNIKINASAYYEYDTSGRLISAKDGDTGYEIRYTYDLNGKALYAQEYGDNIAGQKLYFMYYDGYTGVRTSGSDDIYGNSDDIITNYMFDREGRVISSYSTDPTRTEIYGVSNGEYVTDNEKAKNSLKISSYSEGSNSANYLLNGGFENGLSYWSRSSGNVTHCESYADSNVLEDNEAILSATLGEPAYIKQYVRLKPGHYSLSLDIPSGVTRRTTMTIKAQSMNDTSNITTYTVTDSRNVGKYFAFLDFTANDIIGSGEELFEISITYESNVSGDPIQLIVDNVMLSKGIGAQPYNMVQNGGFESFAVNSSGSALNVPSSFWTMSYDSATKSVTTNDFAPPFESSLTLSGAVGSVMCAEQTIYLMNDDYVFRNGQQRVLNVSGFGWVTEVLSSDKGIFALKLEVTYLEGNVEITEEKYFDFSKETGYWQYVSGTYVIPDHRLVKEIKICCEYSNNTGIAYFDDISVVYDPDGSVEQNYYYQDTGLLALTVSEGRGTLYTYDEHKNLSEVIDFFGKTEYNYDEDNENILESEIYYTCSGRFLFYSLLNNGELAITDELLNNVYASLGSLTEERELKYTYNDCGLVTSTTITGRNAESVNEKYVTSATYNTAPLSKIFGVKTSETDTLARVTRYYYEESSGRLKTVIYPDTSTGLSYQYDDFGRLSVVLPAHIDSTTQTPTAVGNEERAFYIYAEGHNIYIVTNTANYYFEYDEFENSTCVMVEGNALVSYEYNEGNGKLSKLIYGNGFEESYTYDELERLSTVSHKKSGEESATLAYRYNYDSNGNVNKLEDLINERTYIYKYDLENRLSQMYELTNTVSSSSTQIYYDEMSRPTLRYYTMRYSATGGLSLFETKQEIGYNNDGSISEYSVSCDDVEYSFTPTYDSLGRPTSLTRKLSRENTNLVNTVSYQFENNPNDPTKTSARVSEYTSTVAGNTTTYKYTYDANGNIIEIKDASNVVQYRYEYDNLGQLTREDNRPLGKSYVYTYDNAGNRASKNEGAFTLGTFVAENYQEPITYSYDNSWGDQLISVSGNNGGSYSYDAMGNMTFGNIYNFFATFTWNGRQLESYENGHTYISYKYNADGLRIQTCGRDGSVYTQYEYDGDKLVYEYWNGNVIYYVYDQSGSIAGMRYRKSSYAAGVFDEYLFEKNLQGDVVAVYDINGTKLVSYTYDAWGNFETSYHNGGNNTAAKYNPFRYRGYYYDDTMGLYYLNTRYYSPELGRFISADVVMDTASILGFNLFVYCGNNPVMYVDPTGYGRVYVIYYDDPDNGFYEQAMNSPYYNEENDNVYLIGVTSNQDFIDAWNSMSGTIDYVYLYLHGGKGELYFKGETLGFSGKQNFGNLNPKNVKGGVCLLSCKGGVGREGDNVAWMFAKLTNSNVLACTGSVSYSKIFGKYYARKAWDFGGFKRFYYQKRYIFWGELIARSTV